MVLDYAITIPLLLLLLPLFGVVLLIASYDTGFPGIFTQERIGLNGERFTIYKFQTYNPKTKQKSKIGTFLRVSKLDELPQLFNILKGDMSLVGPRPDIPGYYDLLKGAERKVLGLKPGLTSEAGIKYKNEDYLLSLQENPLQYNDEVLFPEKVKMNLQYYDNLSLFLDLSIIWRTGLEVIKSISDKVYK